MENCDVQIHLKDHDYWRQRRISARRAAGAEKPGDCSKCSCCRDDQALNLSATTAKLSRKRKRSSVSRPSKPSSEQPGEVSLVSWPPSAIPPADLPQVLNVPPSPQPPSTDTQLNSTGVNHDGPLKIHNFSVEEFQHIYHEVVDGMLRFKSGRVRPYSLQLGRQIKQKLWERLDRPMTSQTDDEDGLAHVDVTYGVGVYPPLYDVDTSKEPSPGRPPAKRAKGSN